MGIASNLATDRAGVIVLGVNGHAAPRRPGAPQRPGGGRARGRGPDLGEWSTPLAGRWMGGDAIDAGARLPIEQTAPPIMHRGPVQVPLQTRHQGRRCRHPHRARPARTDPGRPPDRQDRNRGRRDPEPEDTGVLSIYCAIGQRASAVARVIHSLREGGALKRTIVVVASGEGRAGAAIRGALCRHPPWPSISWRRDATC